MLHHPARLKIVMLMAATTSSSFNELQRDAQLTAGNLQSHLKALEGAGYVEAWRSLVELKPRMRYRLTAAGREALRAYCDALTRTVQSIRSLTSDPERG
ncbi:MAG TPA: transcriptional regulator [Candidatus Thermoplasmatota archaeon]|nr:transcriptional regulator [Candidatus Thermoplasmatota archaeon]